PSLLPRTVDVSAPGARTDPGGPWRPVSSQSGRLAGAHDRERHAENAIDCASAVRPNAHHRRRAIHAARSLAEKPREEPRNTRMTRKKSHSNSFPSFAWECIAAKLRFAIWPQSKTEFLAHHSSKLSFLAGRSQAELGNEVHKPRNTRKKKPNDT